MGKYKELCQYCFNQRELENASLELCPCPFCGPVVSSYVARDPVVLAEEAIESVFGKGWRKNG